MGLEGAEQLEAEFMQGIRRQPPHSDYWLTRFVFLRGMGLVYLVAFLVTALQWRPLIGQNGLLPVTLYLKKLDTLELGFADLPSLFWFEHSDGFMGVMAWLGVALSAAVMLGFANVPMLALLWALYLSFAQVGQVFYGYGWESLLLEAGFLAIFVPHLWDPRPFSGRAHPSPQVFWLLRWLTFRVLFGAGLIKLRGDGCWIDLSCLAYHYETQPNPHPLSPVFHHMPLWFHQAGVLFNHFVELIVPVFLFGPRRVRHLGATLIVTFQVILILSGNLSFLNWLTLVVTLGCFDDSFWARLAPSSMREWALARSEQSSPTKARRVVTWALVVVVALLSIQPVVNMVSSRQMMNTSFDPLRLVNSYGAFGSVGRVRRELVIEGTLDQSLDEQSRWAAYEFKCKPGSVTRPPCWITPYHYRLDWQIWFAAMSSIEHEPWLVHLVYKLLQADPEVLALLEGDPFDGERPKHIRIELYEYRFAPSGSKSWWQRKWLGHYMRPVSLDDPDLRRFLEARGWLRTQSDAASAIP